MNRLSPTLLLLLAGTLTAAAATTEPPRPFDREIDHVYATVDGIDYYMDVFVPNDNEVDTYYQPGDSGEGIGIIDVASGAWSSDRGKIGDHETAKVYDILCARGYTVFAVRPGSRPEHTVFEMVDNIDRAIRYIKANADKYDIDPDNLGLTGASAGGHLALLTALDPETADPGAETPLRKYSTEVAAVAVFFPPTDFLNWKGKSVREIGDMIGDVLFENGAGGRSQAAIEERARAASPVYHVDESAPPMLIFHGDADPVVPLQQSERFVDAMERAGNSVELVVKAGGGHPWLTIPQEVLAMAGWFDAQLAGVAD